jgi:hypothetical protein
MSLASRANQNSRTKPMAETPMSGKASEAGPEKTQRGEETAQMRKKMQKRATRLEKAIGDDVMNTHEARSPRS